MRLAVGLISLLLLCLSSARAEPARGAYPSANVQFLPAFVALEKGFYKREGLDAELRSVESGAYGKRRGAYGPLAVCGFECAPKRPVRDYMDLRFVNEVVTELGKR